MLTRLDYLREALEASTDGRRCEGAQKYTAGFSRVEEDAKKCLWIETQKAAILKELRASPLRMPNCQRSRTNYNTLRSDPRSATSVETLEDWWGRVRAHACEALRLKAMSPVEEGDRNQPQWMNLLQQVEPWLCILILTAPERDQEALAHIGVIRTVIGSVDRDVTLEETDFFANRHTAYKGLNEQIHGVLDNNRRDGAKSGVHIDPASALRSKNLILTAVVDEQIRIVQKMQTDLAAPVIAVEAARGFLEDGLALRDHVLALDTRLKQWQDRLRLFQKDAQKVIAAADTALDDNSFPLVRAALDRARGEPVPALLNDTVGEGFHGFLDHPTFGHVSTYVDIQQGRRVKQAERKQWIDWCLEVVEEHTLERTITCEELDAHVKTWTTKHKSEPQLITEYNEFAGKLRSLLNNGVFPVERLYEEMQDMHQEEPNDVCHLQEKIRYTDCVLRNTGGPDAKAGARISYETLDSILPIVEKKVFQVRRIRDWLQQYEHTGTLGAEPHTCPGIVSWSEQERAIRALRDQCYLEDALGRCKIVREGDGENGTRLCDGKWWPLERALQSLDAMPDDLTDPLSQAAQQLHRWWKERRDALERDVKECRDCEANIVWRIGERWPRWEELIIAKAKLDETRAAPFRIPVLLEILPPKWVDPLRIVEKEFKRACSRYAEICACDPTFREIVSQESRLYTPPDCPK